MVSLIIAAETYRYALPFFDATPEREHFFSYGFEFPDIPEDSRSAWWMAGGLAARLYATGSAPKFSAPGANWMSLVPEELAGRIVNTGVVKEMSRGTIWAKPAEVKIPSMLPGWWTKTAVHYLNNPAETLYQWTETFLSGLDHEHRVFMLDGVPVTWSAYLVEGVVGVWGIGSPYTDDAVEFASLVAKSMGADFPPTCSLDVGRLPNGRWVVVEANPAWSSGPYGCNLGKLVTVLDRACHENDNRWAWSPSAFALKRASHTTARIVQNSEECSGLLHFV